MRCTCQVLEQHNREHPIPFWFSFYRPFFFAAYASRAGGARSRRTLPGRVEEQVRQIGQEYIPNSSRAYILRVLPISSSLLRRSSPLIRENGSPPLFRIMDEERIDGKHGEPGAGSSRWSLRKESHRVADTLDGRSEPEFGGYGRFLAGHKRE